MALDPAARRAVDLAADDVPFSTPGLDLDRVRETNRLAALEELREDVAEVRDVDTDGVGCRLYRPDAEVAGTGPIVHLHGGGFVFGDLDVHDAACRRLANLTARPVLSVDYRRPPEHRFPAAPDDVDAVLRWLACQADELGLDGPAAIHGDSAGANLALVAALRHPGCFGSMVLIYPFLDPTGGFASYRTVADGGFDPSVAAWYWQQYAGTPADLTDPDLAPLLSDQLGTLPRTMVVTAEHDILRDEGEYLAALLAASGVEVVATRYLGQIHGFWRRPADFPAATPLQQQVAAFLRGPA